MVFVWENPTKINWMMVPWGSPILGNHHVIGLKGIYDLYNEIQWDFMVDSGE